MVDENRTSAQSLEGEGAAAGGTQSAALRIRLSHPWLVDELVGYLARMGFSAHETDYDVVTVEREGQRGDVLEAQLQVYVQVWVATRPGVAAVVECRDAAAESKLAT